MELHAFILSLLILSLVSNSESRSLETPVQCATTCTEPANVAFRQGFTHNFEYVATVSSTFNANSDDTSSTRIRANVAVDTISPCESVLRIVSAILSSDQDISRQSLSSWEQSLRQNPLHFSWQNGRIPNICAANDDPVWVLNIKRGILSTLQVSSVETAEAVEETDVTGTCRSSFTVETSGQRKEIIKRKNYDTCEGREQHLLFSYFQPYSSESPRQDFVHSAQTCTYQLDGSMISGTACTEMHTFRPFSNEESGAQTVIKQRLTWSGSSRRNSLDASLTVGNSHSVSLMFEKEDEATTQSRDISEVQTLFRSLCSTMDTEEYDQVGKDFIKLVFLLRRLDASAIEQVQSTLNGVCPRREAALRVMFKDALQWCGSEGCVVFAARLIARGSDEVPDETARSWLNGMSLITKPTQNMLSAVMEIVESGRLMEKSYLTAGTMIHRVCESSSSCMIEPAMRRALATFEEKLGTNCRTSSDERKQEILFALRALGNAGRTNSISTLARCASEEDSDMETRIGAIQTFRRMPCSNDRSALRNLLLSPAEDSEVRIASYVALMKCPTPLIIQDSVILLDDEPNQQVASFVWSYLNEVMESTDPLKGYMKPLLIETAFAKKHDLDPRKYSRYYEASAFSEQLNAGASVESSVVWSPKSFVPRSADMGLSVDVFGQAVNLFEAGGRVEGVEKIIQNMLSSDGIMRNNPLSELFMSPDDEDDDLDDEDDADEESDVRVARSADSGTLVQQRRQFKRRNQKALDQGEPNGNWYMRVFGNEMLYGNARTLQARAENINVPSILARLLQGGEYSYHDDTMLINSMHILPTGAGLPLTIAFNGSASIDVNINGNMDMRGLFNSPPNLQIRGSMEPRAVVVVSGTMSVDSHVTRTGIATETTAITSWNLGGSATIENGQRFSVNIDAPYQRNTLFKFKHSVMKIYGEGTEEYGHSRPNTIQNCTQEIVGQRMCISRPRNLEIFPVGGPIEMSAYLEKTDSELRRYAMSGSYSSEARGRRVLPGWFEANINMNTPGSTVNRETTVQLTYDLDDMSFNFDMDRLNADVSLTGQFESSPTSKTATITYVNNGERTVFTSLAEKTVVNGVTTWSTSTTLNRPSSRLISGTARATINPARSVSTLVQIQNVFETPIIMNMTLEDKSEEGSHRMWYQGNGQLKIPSLVDTGGNFNLRFQPRSDNFRFRLSYQFGSMQENDIIFNHKRRDRSTSTTTEWNAEQKLAITQFPLFNHFISLNYRNSESSIDSMAKFEYGRHAGHVGNTKYVMLNETLSYVNEGTQKSLNANGFIDIPDAELSLSGSLNHTRNDEEMETTLAVGNYRMSLFLQDNTLDGGLMNKQLRFETPTPWGILLVNDTLVESPRNVYNIQGKLSLGSASGLSLNGTCTVENLLNRKSFSLVVDGNRRNFLQASSLFVTNESETRFENSISSLYNNLVQFNINNQRSESDSESFVLFQHQPNKYLKVTLQKRSEDEMYVHSARVDFNTPQGVRRFMRLAGERIATDTISNITLSFTSDFPAISLNSLALSGQISTVNNRTDFKTWLNKNSRELVGVDGNFAFTQASVDAAIDIRQSLRNIMPRLELNGHASIEGVQRAISANARFNNAEMLSILISATGQSSFDATVSHGFETLRIPTPVHMQLSKGTNDISLALSYTQANEDRAISARIVKNSKQSATFTLTHNDSELPIPSEIDATLHRGTRRSDNGKGIWLTSSMNSNMYLNSEAMFFSDANSVSLNVLHNVDTLGIPRITASASANMEGSRNMQAYLELNDVRVINANIAVDTNNLALHFDHSVRLLNKLNMPRNIHMTLVRTTEEQSGMEVVYELVVDAKRLHVAFTKSEDIVGLISFNSSFPLISGSMSAKVNRLRERNGYRLLVTNDERSFMTSVSWEPSVSWTVRMQQDIFENIIPVWPRRVTLSIAISDNFEVMTRYNDNSLTVTWINNWNRSTNTGSLSIEHLSSGSLFNDYSIPQRSQVRFTHENNIVSLAIEASRRRKQVNLTGSINLDWKSIIIDWNHNIDALEELSVPSSFHVQAALRLSMTTQAQTINMGGTLTLNDRDYTVTFQRSMKIDEMPIQFNATFTHNIMQLYELGVPLEITSNNEISHATLDGEASVVGSVVSKLNRVYLHEITNERVTTSNIVNATIDIELFNKKVELSLFHNLPIPNVPRVLKLDVGVSNPEGSSGIVYKSLKIGLTRDEIKEEGSLIMNLNMMNENQKSLSLAFKHNATWFYQYGVPKNFLITITQRSRYEADFSIVYDTMRRSVGFNVDYHSHEKKLTVAASHDFTIIADAGIPKKIGFEIATPIHDDEADFEVTYVWGSMIKNAHATLKWDLNDKSFRYRHHQNITTIEYVAEQLRLRFEKRSDGFTSRITVGRKNIRIELIRDREIAEITMSQNLFESNRIPRRATLRTEVSSSYRVELSLNTDGDERLSLLFIPTIDTDRWTGSVEIEARQDLLHRDSFPTNVQLYSNASIGEETVTFLRLRRTNMPNFVVGFKCGLNVENRRGYVELIHSQNDWNVLPQKVRVDARYMSSNHNGNMHMLMVDVVRDQLINNVTLTSSYAMTEGPTIYGNTRINHNVEEIAEYLPYENDYSFLFEKPQNSFIIQANATLGDVSYIHSIDATYSMNDGVLSRLEILLDNAYLNEQYNVPQRIAGSVSASWEDVISVSLMTTYGDNSINMHVFTDKETRADFNVSQTLMPTYQSFNLILTRTESNEIGMSVIINGVRKDINLSGNWSENEGRIEFQHPFEVSQLPNHVIVQGSYRLTPDIYMHLIATIDGQSHDFEGGFNKLENGFHVTSTLLGTSRSVTIRQNMIPGGISMEMDHNIPELLEYIPGSTEVSASMRKEPQLNATVSIRKEGQSQRFSTELDAQRLQFTLRHDFETLPFPRLLNIKLLKTLSPLSYEIRVTINDLERTVRASLDSPRMLATFFHSIPELDRWFVARSIAIGLKKTTEPLGGEIYLSIDGVERRAGGSFSLGARAINLFQSTPEFRDYPRNITLRLEGSLVPLNGNIVLTIDETERNIAAQVNPRSLLAALAINAPEAEPFIPSHMSISGNFNETAGNVMISFFKNGRNQSVSAGLSFENGLLIRLVHSVSAWAMLPTPISLQGEVRGLGVSVVLTLGVIDYVVDGNILNGDNDWYGIRMTGNHNDDYFNELGITSNISILLKGRKQEDSYEMESTINLFRGHGYQSSATITPTWRKKRKALQTSYSHLYNGMQRSVSGGISLSKNSRRLSFDFSGEQTQPESRRISLDLDLNKNADYQFQSSLTLRQNIPEMREIGVPSTIRKNVIITIVPDQKMVSWEATLTVNEQDSSSSGDVQLFTDFEKMGLTVNLILQRESFDKTFTLAALLTQESTESTISYDFTSVNRRTGESERGDHVRFTKNSSSSASMQVYQPELNDYGIPRTMDVSFSSNVQGYNKHWVFNFTIDNMPFTWKIDFVQQNSPFFLNVGSSLDSSVSYFENLNLPSHALAYLTIDLQSGNTLFTNETLRVEYNEARLLYNWHLIRNQTYGDFRYTIEHNIPAIQRWLNASKYVEEYWYNVQSPNINVQGHIEMDDVEVGNYTFQMNYDTKEFSYNSAFDKQGYEARFMNVYTAAEKRFFFLILRNQKVLFKIDLDCLQSNQHARVQIINNIWCSFDILVTGSRSENGITGNLQSVISKPGGNCTTIINIRPSELPNLAGHRFSLTHTMGELNINSSVTYGFASSYRRGKLLYDLTGIREPLNLNLAYSPSDATFAATKGEKRIEINWVDNSENELINMQGTFSYANIDCFEACGIPTRIETTIAYHLSNLNIIVSANGMQVVNIAATPSNYSALVKKTDQTIIINSEARYALDAKKQFTFSTMSQQFSFDWKLGGTLQFFRRSDGKSTLTAYLVNNEIDQSFNVTAFALPAFTYDAEDFLARLDATSTFDIAPFRVLLKLRSNYITGDSWHYTGSYAAKYNNRKLSVDIDVKPKNFTLVIAQPFIAEVPIITIHLEQKLPVREQQYKISMANFSWSNNENDKLNIMSKLRSSGPQFYYSLDMAQPSAILNISSCGAIVDGDVSSGNVRFGFNSYLNDYRLGTNASYVGVLPQLFGLHRLVVDISQPILLSIPSHFKTSGNITISSSMYSSDWTINTGDREHVALRKHFRIQDSGVSMDLLWRQALFGNVPLRYINVEAESNRIVGGKEGSATLQIDDMPQISGSYRLNEDSSTNNKTFRVNLASGPLPVGFRSLSLTSWYKMETSRQRGPKFSISANVDNSPYHLYFESEKVESSSTIRSSNGIKLAHPMNLRFFGIPLANEVAAKMTLLKKNGNPKLIISYNDNLLENPFKATTMYRFNDGSNKFRATMSVETDATYDLRFTMTSDSVTVSATCPEKQLNMELVLNGRNNEDTFEVGGSLKNYAADMNWDVDFSYDKNENTIELVLASPTLERTTLRGDLSQVLQQMKVLIRRFASDATSSRIRFIKGLDATSTGYDMYVGYDVSEGSSYTLHILVGKENGTYFAAMQVKRDFEMQAEVARTGVELIDNRLVQLQLSANPVLVNFVRKTIEDLDTEATRKINWFADNLIEGLESLKTIIVGNSEVEATVNSRVDAVIAKVNNYRDEAIRFVSMLASNTNRKFGIASLMTEEGVRSALTEVLSMVETGRSIMLRPFTNVFDQYFGALLNRTNEEIVRRMEPAIAMLRRIRAGQLLIELIEEATQRAFEYIMTNGETCFASARQPLSDLLYVDGSHIIFNIPLSFEVEELKPLPSLEDVKTWLAQSALALTINDGMEKLYSYVDDYYKARALVYIPRDEILPPFKGHAFVSGFKHFSTFDKRNYDFSSGCATSHVLVADMRDNNFTVAISYADPDEENSRNSIEVIVKNRRVTVFEDYRVEVDGQEKGLPYDLRVLSVLLQGNAIHVRTTDGNMDVACDFTKKLCTVDVSPYYFGATAGMAGVYNNEPMDDYNTPQGSAATATELGSEWESSGAYCSEPNVFRPCDSNRVPARCNSLFRESDSPLRPCFPLIDPQPFLEMCQNDMCESRNAKTSCAAVHAYAYRCNLVGARFQLPAECVECPSVDRSPFDSSESHQSEISTMDFVLVIEQGSCMSGVTSSMKRFMKKLISSLSDARMRDVHYHLVGYGGPGAGAMPSTLTIRGKQFSRSRNHFLKALKKIKWSREEVYGDTLGAISYATQLSFRSGAKPVIVALSCGSCHASDASYSAVERQIRKQGIILHHLPQRPILAGSSSKSMFGFDNTNAFSRGNDVSSNAIKPNKQDVCEPLAKVTGGSVWDGSFLLDNNSHFHNKFSSYIVDRVPMGQRETCRCEMNRNGMPTSVCSP